MAHIRQIVAAEASALCSDIVRLFSQLSRDPAQATARQIETSLASPDIVVLGAFEHRELVGMATLALMPLLNKTIASTQDVVVAGSQRGKGVGRQLILRLLDHARKRGAVFCDLTSSPERTEANRLYQRLGFELRVTNAYRYRF